MCVCLREGVSGHSSVWHNASAAVYVFGGYELTAETAALTNSLYSVHLTHHQDTVSAVHWNRLTSPDHHEVPHSLVLLFDLSRL